jgi:outer membrane protein TolC
MNLKQQSHYYLLFFLLSMPFLALAWGQDSTARHLTLEEAVRSAMKNNPDLESARLEVKKSDARVLEAWGYAMPSVDLSSNFVHLIDKPVSYFPDYILYPLAKILDSTVRNPKPIGALIRVPGSLSPDYSASASLNFRQIIFNGAVFVGVGAAHVYSHLARDLYQGKHLETIAKVRKAYYQTLLAREAMELMRSSLKNAEDNLKNVQLMQKQGIVSDYDELRASVGVENLSPAVIQSESNYFLALDNLRNMVGLPAHENIILDGELKFEAVDDTIAAQAESLILESNPGLAAVKRQIELNGAVINAERSNYLPTIAMFGSYSYSAIKDRFNFSTNDFYKSSQIGLSFSLSLFQGLQTYARVEQAQLEQRKSEEQKNNVERNLRTGALAVQNSLKQARKRVAAQNRTVEMAERGYKIVTTRFLSNSATQLEVNDAQLALTQAKVNRIQAIYDYLVASADLDQLIGHVPNYAVEIEE